MADEPAADRLAGIRLVQLDQAEVIAHYQEIAAFRQYRCDSSNSQVLVGFAGETPRIWVPEANRPVLSTGREERPTVTEPHEHCGMNPSLVPSEY